MHEIRFLDLKNLPALSEDTRQAVEFYRTNKPKETVLLMVRPVTYQLTDDALTTLAQHGLSDALLDTLRHFPRREYADAAAFWHALLGFTPALAPFQAECLAACEHPLSGQLVPAILPPLSTRQLELVAGAIHGRLGAIIQRNSNPCQCWREQLEFEERRITLIRQFTDGVTDRPELEQQLADIDALLTARFKGQAYPRYALSPDDAPCPRCGKLRELEKVLSFVSAGFLANLVKIAVGGELPLVSLSTFAQTVYEQLTEADFLPPAKKKKVQEFLEMLGLKPLLTNLLRSVPTPLTTAYATTPSSSVTSTATSQNIGDSARPTLTPDLPPLNSSGSLPNTANVSDSSLTS